MEIITMEKQAYKNLLEKIERVHQEIIKLQDPARQIAREWVTTQEAMQIMRCSRRTLVTYKQQGYLVPTTVKNKDYYELRDIKELLENSPNKSLSIQNQKI